MPAVEICSERSAAGMTARPARRHKLVGTPLQPAAKPGIVADHPPTRGSAGMTCWPPHSSTPPLPARSLRAPPTGPSGSAMARHTRPRPAITLSSWRLYRGCAWTRIVEHRAWIDVHMAQRADRSQAFCCRASPRGIDGARSHPPAAPGVRARPGRGAIVPRASSSRLARPDWPSRANDAA